MYITNTLSEACPSFLTSFSSAERDITDKDAAPILTILGGPSPWQQFLQQNLATHRRTLPAKPIRICDEREFASSYRRVHQEAPSADTQGFVDRRNGMMILKEFPIGNIGKSKVGIAVHEAVHLFSHPPGKSNRIRATAFSLLGPGLLEGITQMVTDDILRTQCISAMRSQWQPYKEVTAIARRFLASFSQPVVGNAYFQGDINQLLNLIQIKWTERWYVRLRDLADRKQMKAALSMIDTLDSAEHFDMVSRGIR